MMSCAWCLCWWTAPVLNKAQRISISSIATVAHCGHGEYGGRARQYVYSKEVVDYVTWNRLVGVTDPARLDECERRPSLGMAVHVLLHLSSYSGLVRRPREKVGDTEALVGARKGMD